MIINSVKLHNIRSYLDETINLPKGSTLLIGDIGSGKTTILLAIEFAIFGILRGEISGDTLLRNGKKDGFVELNLDIENKNIIIRRNLKKSKNAVSQETGYIIIDNIKTEGTAQELKSKILELIGYPDELLTKNKSLIFRYTVYTPQEEMKNILFEEKDERLNTLRRVFNIDKYKRIKDNATLYIRELKSHRKLLQSQIDDLNEKQEYKKIKQKETEEIEKQIKELISADDEFSEKIAEKRKEKEEIEEKIKQLNNSNNELQFTELKIRNKNDHFTRNTKEINIIEFRIEEIKKKLEEIKSIPIDEQELKNKLNEMEDNFAKIKTKKQLVAEQLEFRETQLKKIVFQNIEEQEKEFEKLKNSVNKKEEIEKNIFEKEFIVEKLKLNLNSLKIKNENSKKTIKDIREISKCPVCLQDVNEEHKQKIISDETRNIDELRPLAEKLENEISINVQDLNLSKNEIDFIRKAELKLKGLEIKISDTKEKNSLFEKLTEEIKALNALKQKIDSFNAEDLVQKISKYRKVLSNIESKRHFTELFEEKTKNNEDLLKSNNEIQEEIKLLNEKLGEINEKIYSFGNIDDKYQKIKDEFEYLTTEERKHAIKKASFEREKQSVQRMIDEIENEINKKLIVKEKIKYIDELHNWLNEYFINLIDVIEKNIMAKIHSEFNELFKTWFSMLIEEEAMSVRMDEEFTPVIEQNGYENYLENLSGGEKTAISLAYRLALNRVINEFIGNIKTRDIIILDEPTDGFSSEQLDKMRDVLDELNMKQTIIVSHESKMESFVDNIIRIFKNEHVSSVIV